MLFPPLKGATVQILSQLLDGKKTTLAGLGLILWAAAGFLLSVSGIDSAAALDANQALQHALEGLALLGLGGKLEKQTEEIKVNTEALKQR